MKDFPPSEPYKTPTSAPLPNNSGVSGEEKNWAMVAHLLPLVAWGVPFGNIIAPAVIWFLKREEMPFVNEQAREALNFQITMVLAGTVCVVLALFLIGIPLLLALIPVGIVFPLLAAKNCQEGQPYRYPFCLRLV